VKTQDLDFPFPNDLIATEPLRPSRVAFAVGGDDPEELTIPELLAKFNAGDVLVINESKVIPARVFAGDSEILFLQNLGDSKWQVLFNARDFKVGAKIDLPGGAVATLEEKGLPQTVSVSRELDAEYFAEFGEVALPPYIQEARGERHNRPGDFRWYQTAWAKTAGSVAAPTASLHFTTTDIKELRRRGVTIATVTLHVGAGTFLPVKTEDLKEHVMHAETAEVPASAVALIEAAKASGKRVWALGTTVTRTLESMAAGILEKQDDGSYRGSTKLFIYPPYEFQVVDVLLTNFHQPRSTLLGLVSAFAGTDYARKVYEWAIEHRFRLFSYGDLSVWTKQK
jgi:S-adenosylmethionine:tRNA ribosyltransferase-isomerase